jgi:hypothetical protein
MEALEEGKEGRKMKDLRGNGNSMDGRCREDGRWKLYRRGGEGMEDGWKIEDVEKMEDGRCRAAKGEEGRMDERWKL